MQDEEQGIDQQTRSCPSCERTISRNSHHCPYCRQSLADLKKLRREPSSPHIKRERINASKAVSGKIEAVRVPVLVFLVLSLVSFIAFKILPSMIDGMDRPKALLEKHASRYPDPPRHRADQYPPAPTHVSGLRMVSSTERIQQPEITTKEDPTSSLRLASNTATVQEQSSGRDTEIEERARAVYTQVLEDLRENGSVTRDKIYMKSGAEFQGTVLEQSDDHIKVRYKGLTTTIEKEKIERIESRPAGEVERELNKLASIQAKKIMRAGLVRHGKEWITPEEKAERIRAAGEEENKKGIITARNSRANGAAPKSLTPYNSRHFKGKTWQEKVDMISALARQEGSKSVSFFGGSLWLEIIDALPTDADAESAPIAFEARARNLDIAELSEASGSPIRAAGSADADVEVEVDVADINDLTSLTGKSIIIAKKVDLPWIDLGPVLLPANYKASFNADLAAEDGSLAINACRFEGSAYSFSGDGIIHLASPIERSPIELALLVLLKEAPTIKDRALAEAGGAVIINALVAGQTELPIKITGTLEKPEVKLDTSSLTAAKQ